MMASFVCIAQNSVQDNTSEASRTGTGAFTCTVVCDDDDDEEEDGIKVLPDDDYGSAVKSITAYKGTAGFGIKFTKKKDGFTRDISGINEIGLTGEFIFDGLKWNFMTVSEQEKRRITGRDADADGFAEDSDIKLLFFPENPETLIGFNKKIINFELNINSTYQEM